MENTKGYERDEETEEMIDEYLKEQAPIQGCREMTNRSAFVQMKFAESEIFEALQEMIRKQQEFYKAVEKFGKAVAGSISIDLIVN